MLKVLMLRWIYFFLAITALPALAAIDVHEFANDVERERYQSFIDEMRCPKCQNQNLSGSDSPIATDLRNQLFVMIKDGRSDKEIVDFMVERYGEFILYRPRLTSATVMLWALPGILLLVGIGILVLIVRKRRTLNTQASGALSANEQQKLQHLLQSKQQPVSAGDHRNHNNNACKKVALGKGAHK